VDVAIWCASILQDVTVSNRFHIRPIERQYVMEGIWGHGLDDEIGRRIMLEDEAGPLRVIFKRAEDKAEADAGELEASCLRHHLVAVLHGTSPIED
jgi:hypothetical protein